MSSQDERKPPRPAANLRTPTASMLRVGTPSRPAGLDTPPEEHPRLADGAPLSSAVPQFDLKTLTLIDFSPADKRMELRDKKNTALRLLQKGAAQFELDTSVGREKKPSIPLTMQMGRELLRPLHDAIQRAVKDGRLAPHRGALDQMISSLASACDMPLQKSALMGASEAAATVERQKVGYDAIRKEKNMTGYQPIKSAPPTKAPEPVAAADAISRAAPGVLQESLVIQAFNASQSFVVLADDAGNELQIQQIKFTPPPQFHLKYTPSGGAMDRSNVPAPLARELAQMLRNAFERSPEMHAQAPARLVNLLIQALGKVM